MYDAVGTYVHTHGLTALLFVSRFAVRIEGYLKVAIRHNKWINEKSKLSRANSAAHVRGFRCEDKVINEMEKNYITIANSIAE